MEEYERRLQWEDLQKRLVSPAGPYPWEPTEPSDAQVREEVVRLQANVDRRLLFQGQSVAVGRVPLVCRVLELWGGAPCVAAVDWDGGLLLVAIVDGKLGDRSPTLSMEGFDPGADEVVTILSSVRALSPRQDLLVVVRRWTPDGASPALRLYRATVARSPGRWDLRPTLDDHQDAGPWRSTPMQPDDTNSWMLGPPVNLAQGVDPIKRPLPRLIEQWPSLLNEGIERAQRGAWDGELAAWLTAGQDCIVQTLAVSKNESSRAGQVPSNRPADDLCLGKNPDGRRWLVLCSPEGWIAAFERDHSGSGREADSDEASWKLAWQQEVDCAPTCCTVLHVPPVPPVPKPVSGDELPGWSAVVVGTREGWLHLYRPAGTTDPSAVRDRLVRDLVRRCGLGSIPAWQDQVDCWTKDATRHELKVLACLLVRLLDLAGPSGPLQPATGDELRALARFLAGPTFVAVQADVGRALGRLAQSLVEQAVSQETAATCDPSNEKGWLFAWEAYKAGTHAMQEACDQHFQPATSVVDKLPELGKELARARRSNLWDELDKSDQPPERKIPLLVDLATERWVQERSTKPEPPIETMAPGLDGALALGLSRVGLLRVDLVGNELQTHLVWPQDLRPRQLLVDPESGLLAIAERRSRAWIRRAGADWERIDAPWGRWCAGMVLLDAIADGARTLVLAWVEQRRSFLELLDLGPRGATSPPPRRVGYRPLPIHEVGAMVRGPGEDSLWVGDRQAGVLARFARLREAGETAYVADLSVDLGSGITSLAWCGDTLVVGTKAGLVWGLDRAGRTRWTFQARHRVRQVASLPDGNVLILARPNDLVVLDEEGRRVWRRERGGPWTGCSQTASSGGVHRLLATAEDHRLVLLRQPQDREAQRLAVHQLPAPAGPPDHWRAQEAEEVRRALDARSMAAQDRLGQLLAARSPRARARLIELLGADPTLSPSQREELRNSLGASERWRLVRAVRGGKEDPWHAEVDRLVRSACAEDPAGRRFSTRVALVELLRRLRRVAQTPAELAGALELVTPTMHDDGRPWVAVEAVQTWRTIVLRGAGPEVNAEEDADLLAMHLHLLPVGLAWALPHVLRCPGGLAWAPALVRLKDNDPRGATPVDRTSRCRQLLDKSQPGPLVQALSSLLALADPQTADWSAVAQAWHTARAVPREAQGPLAELARWSALSPGLGAPPSDQAPQAQQEAWLRGALLHLAERASNTGPEGADWQEVRRIIEGWAARGLRALLRSRLEQIESRVRVRPELRTELSRRPSPFIVELMLELSPEGHHALPQATVLLRFPPDGPLTARTHKLDKQWQFRELNPKEAPLLYRFEAVCDAVAKDFVVEVEVMGSAGTTHRQKWTLPLPPHRPVDEAPPRAAFPDRVPTAFQAVLDQANRLRRGLVVLAADEVLAPELLARRLAELPHARRVELDSLLALLGPGRTYPRPLRQPEVLGRALVGLPPLARNQRPDDAPGLQGLHLMVLAPAMETVDRLLLPELAAEWAAFQQALADHVAHPTAPALLLVLPSPLAAAFRRRLELLAEWWSPATLDEGWLGQEGMDRAEKEVSTWLRREARLDEGNALDVFWRAGADLRVLAEWLALGGPSRAALIDDALIRWGRVDLTALSPGELAALVALAETRTQLPPARLEPGMVVDQEVRTKPTAGHSQPKLLATPGMLVTRRLKARLQTQKLSTITVAGWAGRGGPTTSQGGQELLTLLPDSLEEMARRLRRAGYATQRGGLVTPGSLYQCVIQATRRRERDLAAVWRALAPDMDIMDAIPLARLTRANEEICRMLGLPTERSRVALVAKLAERWAAPPEAPPSAGSLAQLLRELTGATFSIVPASKDANEPGSLLDGLHCPRASLFGTDPLHTRARHRLLVAWLPRAGESTPIEAPHLEALEANLEALAVGMTDGQPGPRSLLVLLGPGLEALSAALAGTDRPHVALFWPRDLHSLLRAPDLGRHLWATIRAHVGLSAVSPFVTVGALPPGSSLFVGRADVLERVRTGISRQSFLVMGPRRIGKTSLLHAIFHELGKVVEPDGEGLCPLPTLLSLQGRTQPDTLVEELRLGMTERNLTDLGPNEQPFTMIQRLVRCDRSQGHRTVFVMNEIDGMLRDHPEFFELLRDLAEKDGARFVFGGYAQAFRALHSLKGAFFHFTSGAEGNRYFDLSALHDDAEARALLALLLEPPLDLRWVNERERQLGEALVIERSYRIPWVIQAWCSLLLERLGLEQRAVIHLDDVRHVVEQRQAILEHLDELDVGELVGRPGDRQVKLFVRALLAALVEKTYFRGQPAPIDDPNLPDADPRLFAFTAEAAQTTFREATAGWLGSADARRVLDLWATIDLDELLRGLTLTLILQEVVGRATEERRYCFQLHLYPLELKRAGKGHEGPAQRLSEALRSLSGP